MNIEQAIKDILVIPGVVEASLWGSRFILPEHEHMHCVDWDVLVLGASHNGLMGAGFVPDCSTDYEGTKFKSWRKGELNLVVVYDGKFYDLCVAIAEACRASHRAGAVDMRYKENRILAHMILKGEA